jgi:enoyl-CoA hydratase/carnithine racemase
MTSPVRYEQQGNIVLLTLDDPATRNSISPEMIAAIVEAVDRINGDLSVSCVIVSGAGKAFCSGGNINDMRDRTGYAAGGPADIRRAMQRRFQRVPLALYDLEVPSIAAVNGPAVGAGCDISLMCDIRIASTQASFAESFIRLGVVSGDGGAWFLPRVVGLSRAYQMTFTGEAVSGERALSYGLVSEVVAPEALMTRAFDLAKSIAAHPPQSLRLAKRLVRESAETTLQSGLELAAAMQGLAQHTSDHREAVAAFLDKRPPQYRAE